MLVDSLNALRSRIIDEFCAAMEFKAFTDLAYIFASQRASQLGHDSKFVLGYSEYASAMGLSNREVLVAELPKHFANAKDGYFFSMVHQHQVALFEHLFFDLLRLILQDQPRHLSGKRQIDYATILNAETKDEIVQQLIDRELNEVKYKNVSEWFAYLQKLVSIPDAPKEDLEGIAEAKATRDLLVHNAGVVNEIYLNKAGNAARFSVGQRVDVAGHYTRDTWQVFARVLLSITDSLIQKLGTPKADA